MGTGGPLGWGARRVVCIQRLSRPELPSSGGRRAHEALERWGAGSGASRLVTGTRPIHSDLEVALADWKGAEAAVCFPTGFAANLGVLCAFGGPGVRVLSDELNHASIIDGCRLSRSSLAVYRHRDLDHLEELLSVRRHPRAGPAAYPTIIVTDTVFSMDGDVAPVDELVSLCARHGALLVLDEAHAVLGPSVPAASTAPIVRVGTLRRRWDRWGVSSQRHVTWWICWSTGPARTSSRPH